MSAEQVDETITPRLVDASRPPNVPLHLAVLDELGNSDLECQVALPVDAGTEQREALEQRRPRDGVANPKTRREHLRERADVDHDAGAVRARERKDRTALVVELVIVVVLDDGEPVLGASASSSIRRPADGRESTGTPTTRAPAPFSA